MLKLLSGNPGKQSFSQLMEQVKDPGVPVAAPSMPDFLSDEAVAEWEQLLPHLIALGFVSRLDTMALATYCQNYADWQRMQRKITELNRSLDKGDVQTYANGAQQISVWQTLAEKFEKRANAAGAQFGLSPMARRNLKTLPQGQGELFPNEQRDAADKYFN
ncbi:phage terminase small subunit P27 family [Pseudomonas extremaustralis]|uniref:phage terminase small subunit P27 family n=1 Tax=Pseudomonas extremaustralis TaxID=359110 RepID=UPI002867A699|nr:phage terminase small subunit P27 family [Pseudomonas extremaustralis]MDR6580157.1 P27 family predicted phage terminase small subunit [Pseudomonas extremaustralis]